jgi:hypothetical protein
LIKAAIEQMLKFGRILHFLKNIKPRYLLSLDSQFYNISQRKIVYRFKVFGEHTFPKFTFDDIKNDNNILHDIHPTDLMKITVDNYVVSQKNSLLSISEILRENKYKLTTNESEAILSGDEICENILLIEKIKNIDLYKIAYNTGFNHGRQLAREISKKTSIKDNYSDNVLTLQIIESDKS